MHGSVAGCCLISIGKLCPNLRRGGRAKPTGGRDHHSRAAGYPDLPRVDRHARRPDECRHSVTSHRLPAHAKLFGRHIRQKRPAAFHDRSTPTSSSGGPGTWTTRPGERPAGTIAGTVSTI